MSRHALPEAPPVPNQRVPIVDRVIEDLRERSLTGEKKYGTKLQAHNGRNALVDLYQELLDGAMYVRQRLEEENLDQSLAQLCEASWITSPGPVTPGLYTRPGRVIPVNGSAPVDSLEPSYTARALLTQSVLREAESLVEGSRGDAYGHPFDDFSRTATAVTSFLEHKLKPGCKFVAEDVALFMICAKLSREMNRPKHDNLVDAAGYILTWDKVKQERVRRG